jgi:predicted  nucleic acid-binding Zn-ribbon protein
MDKGHETSIALQLLFLLRQQRYLYHQLKILTDRQNQLSETNSPEQMLEIINGRRKLIEKLRQTDGKLRPIKTNWTKLSRQIGPEHRKKAHELVSQIQELVAKISASCPSETFERFPPNETWEINEIFAEKQP